MATPTIDITQGPGLPTTLREVMLALQAQVVAKCDLPAERVPIMDPDSVDMPPQQAEQVCFLWPDLESNAWYPAAGRLYTAEDMTIIVDVFTRLARDEGDSLKIWLTDAVDGHVKFRHQVLNALIGFWPPKVPDVEGDLLTTHPIMPTSNVRPRPNKQHPGWGRSRLGFVLRYVLVLPQDDAEIPASGGIP